MNIILDVHEGYLLINILVVSLSTSSEHKRLIKLHEN